MIFVNALYKAEKLNTNMMDTLLLLLAPFVPHVASELYELRGHSERIDFISWPKYDEKELINSTVNYAIQVNGKLKGLVEFEKDSDDKEALIAEAMKIDLVKKACEGKTIVKTIVVKNKIVNIVIK